MKKRQSSLTVKKREQVRYLVVQESVAGGPRTQFDTPEAAYREAEGLLAGTQRYRGYRRPGRLLVVQIVGAVEVTHPTRRLTAAQLPRPEPTIELNVSWEDTRLD